MTPQLPEKDRELIETIRIRLGSCYCTSETDCVACILRTASIPRLLSIISRLQLALGKAVEQRDKIIWALSALGTTGEDAVKAETNKFISQHDQELQKILEGGE